MTKFIKLTEFYTKTNSKVFLSVNHIVGLSTENEAETKLTAVKTSGGGSYLVVESPAMVMKLIEIAEKGDKYDINKKPDTTGWEL